MTQDNLVCVTELGVKAKRTGVFCAIVTCVPLATLMLMARKTNNTPKPKMDEWIACIAERACN